MFNTCVRNDSAKPVRGGAPALFACLSLLVAAPLAAQTTLPPVSVGAGVQTSFVNTMPDGDAESTQNFFLNSIRLYVSGSAAENVKFTFNTEYDGGTNHVGVMDAVAQFEMSPKFNIWVGRFLPPSDRANLYGPYYAHHWATYTDGVQDGYPFVATGRDNGVAYWGQFGKVKVSGGAFDGDSATGKNDLIWAGRVMVDLWDPEAGYYLNGTYYGEKNLLAIGAAGQVQDDDTAVSVDLLLERKVGTEGGAFTVEAEYAKYDHLGGYSSRYGVDKGGYVLGSYLFPGMVGKGKIEVLGKFADAKFSEGLTVFDKNYEQKTTEINLNYLIRTFNARVMLFFKNTDFNAVRTDFKQVGVGVQLQM